MPKVFIRTRCDIVGVGFPLRRKCVEFSKRRNPRIRLAVYQSFNQSSNAILIHSEFMGFFQKWERGFDVDEASWQLFFLTLSFLKSILEPPFLSSFIYTGTVPKKGGHCRSLLRDQYRIGNLAICSSCWNG